MCDQHTNKKSKKSKLRWGSALEHGKAHQQHHDSSRRSFLKNLGLVGGASMTLGSMPLLSAASSSLASALTNLNNDRVLVLIRLKGGNDGLNTIIPTFDYDTYANKRPDIRIGESDIRQLGSRFGMPKLMDDLYPLWQDGKMKVVNSVGYDNQNLSHFRSFDIWDSASDHDEFITSGWLGRYIVNNNPDYQTNPPETPPAVQIGSIGSLTFNDTEQVNLSVAVSQPEELAEIAENGQLHPLTGLPDCYYGEQLGFLRLVTNNTFKYAEVIGEAYQAGKNNVTYTGRLGEQLALVARLIKGNLGTKVFMVSIGGFDTHANQPNVHADLLTDIAKGVSDFFADLQSANMDENVLCATFSEFGRRIEQNSSMGTDHGAAAPMMLFGGGLNGNGVLGKDPDMLDVDRAGNLKYDTDFRQVYATLLENWLCVDPMVVDGVLGRSFQRVNLGLDCTTVSNDELPDLVPVQHEVRYADAGSATISYTIPRTMRVRLEVFDLLGRPISLLVNERQVSGTHQAAFTTNGSRLPTGVYVYHIQAEGQMMSGQIRLVR